MALKYESTGQYFKINKEKCVVEEKKLHISYCTYKNASERNREKLLKTQFDTTYSRIVQKLNDYERRAKEIFEELNPIYGNNSDEMRSNNGEFKNICESLGKMNYLKDNFYNLVYSFNKELEKYSAPFALHEFSIPEEWVLKPILVSENLYVLNEYNGEEIEYAFLYNSLKKASVEKCIDC